MSARNSKNHRCKRAIKLLYSGSLENLNEQRLYEDSFGKLSLGERCKAAWELVELAWKLKGKSKDELRFQRSVVLFKRI